MFPPFLYMKEGREMTKEERAAVSRANGLKSKKYNNYKVVGNVVYVELTNSHNTMICDLDVWEKVKEITWQENSSHHYVVGRINGKQTRFHQLVLPKKEGVLIDHKNRNRLDNRRVNLRYASCRANVINCNLKKTNKSGHKGVMQTKSGNWVAYIWLGKQVCLGTYKTYEEACLVREQAEEKYHKPILEKETY